MEEIKKVISIETKNSNRSINSLKKDIDKLTESLNGLEIGTKEYNETLFKLSSRQKEFNKISEQIARSSRTTAQRFESVAKISAGLASGYGAATAAVTLFGKESEDLNKIMVKLQSTIALVQGIGGLKDLIEELPILGEGFKKLVGFINPFNTSLNDAAKNLNNIDTGKLKSINAQVANIGSEAGGLSKTLNQLEGSTKGGIIGNIVGDPNTINNQTKAMNINAVAFDN